MRMADSGSLLIMMIIMMLMTIMNHDSDDNGSNDHGCIVAKMPGTSEPFLKPDGNLSPTGK